MIPPPVYRTMHTRSKMKTRWESIRSMGFRATITFVNLSHSLSDGSIRSRNNHQRQSMAGQMEKALSAHTPDVARGHFAQNQPVLVHHERDTFLH